MSDYWTRIMSARLSRRKALGTTFAAGAGVVAFGTVGCGGDDDDTDGSTPSGDTTATPGGNATPGSSETATPGSNGDSFQENASLRAAIGSDIGSSDPHAVAGTGGGNWPNYTTHFTTALGIDPETSAVVPYAASHEWTDENSALLVTARDGVTFHNGETLNAEVLKFNVDRLKGKPEYNPDYASGNATLFGTVDRVEVVDEMTVKIFTNRPDVALPYKLATGNVPLVPMQYILDNGDQEMTENPIGHGPFQFVSRRPDVEIQSTRFDDFFYAQDENLGPRLPYIKDLTQRVIPEDAARAAALETGEVDMAVNVSSDIGKSFEERDGYQVFYLPGDQPMHIHFNTRLENDPITGGPNPLRDRRVRLALNHAVDVDTIISTILTGRENYSYGFSSAAFGYPKAELEALRIQFDPERAKSLLAEAGFEDGFEIDFTGPIARWPNSDQVMQAIAGYLQEVGVRTKIATAQYQPWVTEVQSHEKPGMWFMGLSGGLDPANNFRYGFHTAAPYGSSINPELELDPLIAASEAEFDPTQRAELIKEIIVKQYEDATWLYLYEPVTVVVATDQVDWQFYGKVLSTPQYWNMRMKA